MQLLKPPTRGHSAIWTLPLVAPTASGTKTPVTTQVPGPVKPAQVPPMNENGPVSDDRRAP
jgi:hypothetical protein